MKRLIVSAAFAVALAACGQAANTPPDPAPSATPSAPNAASLKAASVTPEPGDDALWAAASVSKVALLERGDAKLYSTVGGDPAINGEYVFLAVIGEPQEGWKVFKVGDFNSWDVVSQTPERVVLKVSHSAVEETTGEIVTAEQTIAVDVPAYGAASINVTPVE